MSILNYFFIGFVFIFLVDIIAVWTRKKPEVQKAMVDFGLKERLLAVLIWPLASLMFFTAFFKSYFKKNK
jgi:hypothetical protein